MARTDLARRFGGFLGVGAIGFVVDVGLFSLLLDGFGFGAYVSRGLAFATALATTYVLNRSMVWSERTAANGSAEAGRYVAASLVAGACNLAVYAGIVALFGAAFPLAHLALAAGVGAGLLVNFVLYDRLVFRRPPVRPDKV